MALNLKGIEYEINPVHLVKDGGQHLKPEYQEINPAMMVPTLQIGDLYLTESMPICEYIQELYPD